MPERQSDATVAPSAEQPGDAAGEGSLATPGFETEGRGAGARMKQTGREVVEELRARGRQGVEEASRTVGETVDRRSTAMSEPLGALGRALATAAGHLEEEDRPTLARYVRRAAGGVDRVTGYLRDQDASSMKRDVEDVARSNPALFLGGVFLTGLALGRFLHSSEPDLSSEKMASSSSRGQTRSTKTNPVSTGGGHDD